MLAASGWSILLGTVAQAGQAGVRCRGFGSQPLMSRPWKQRPVCRQTPSRRSCQPPDRSRYPFAGHGGKPVRLEPNRLAINERRPPRGVFPLQTSGLLCTPIHPLDPLQGLLQNNQVLGLPTRAAAHGHGLLVPCQQANRFWQRAFGPRRDAAAKWNLPSRRHRWPLGIRNRSMTATKHAIGSSTSGAGRHRPMRGACGFRAPADYRADVNIPARTAPRGRGPPHSEERSRQGPQHPVNTLGRRFRQADESLCEVAEAQWRRVSRQVISGPCCRACREWRATVRDRPGRR